MNVRTDLSQEFVDISAQVVEIGFRIQEGAFGIDDEGSSKVEASFFIIHAEQAGYLTSRVRPHRILDLLQHFFISLPSKVDELGIGADSDHFSVQFPEFFILLCQSSEFSGSNEGKIGGVEK